MTDAPPEDPSRETAEQVRELPGKPLLIRLQDAFAVAWEHDELFRYALILGVLASLVILFHAGSGTGRFG